MAKIKDACLLGNKIPAVYKTYGLQYETVQQNLHKNTMRDVDSYLYQMELSTKKGAQYKKPRIVKKKTKAQIQDEEDWAYDQMVDNRLTLGI